MDDNTLTITLFLLASALLLGVEAVKSSGKLRYGFGAGAGAFVLLGLLWDPAAKMFPDAARAVGEVAGFPPSWFFLILVIFLVVRERWAVRGRSGETESLPPATADNAVGQIEVLRDMLATIQADNRDARLKVQEALETANGLAETIERASQRADAKADAAQSTADFAINKLSEREGAAQAIDSRINDLVELAESMSGKVNEQGSEVAALTRTVDRLLRAQFAMKLRGALDSIEAEIAKLDALLYFEDGKGIGAVDWDTWKQREADWRRGISIWTTRAAPYGNGDLAAQIKNTPQEDFYGTWSFKDSDLPDADTIHRYKAFCIMRRNFSGVREAVDNALYDAIYG